MLVLIGPDWLNEINRRAGLSETDFVRNEVEPQPALKHSLAFRGLLRLGRLQ